MARSFAVRAVSTLILLVCSLSAAFSSTHWIVTEDGMIQGQGDSVFYLRRPYDLVALIQQEHRAAFVDSLARDLEDPLTPRSANVSITNTYPKTWNISNNEECYAAQENLSEFNVYESIVPQFSSRNIRILDYIANDSEVVISTKEPSCTSAVELDFSMHAFEHLQVMRWRQNVTVLPEIELVQVVPMLKDIAGFRNSLHDALVKKPTSWMVHTLASFYFRLLGDAYNAIECLRRALNYVPRAFKDIPLLCLGNLLHRSQHTEEAAIVVHAAVDMAPHVPINHYLLGNIYMAMLDFTISLICYKNVLQLDPSNDEAAFRIFTLGCHSKLETAPKSLLGNIQRKLSRLSTFEKHVEFLQQRVRLMQEQAALEVRVTSQVQYAEEKIRQRLQETMSFTDRKDCIQSTQNGLAVLSCGGIPKITFADFHIVLDDSLQQLLKELDTRVSNLHSIVPDESAWPSPMSSPPANDEQDWTMPTVAPLYPRFRSLWSTIHEEVQVIQSVMEDCESSYYEVSRMLWFLPPENKGFEVSRILGELQGLKSRMQHPLPWHKPYCSVIDEESIPVESFITPLLNPLHAFPSGFDGSMVVRQYLMRYSNGGDFSVEEFGQRLVSASRMSLGPKWLLESLGSLYWLAVDDVKNAVLCLRSSISQTPQVFLDVPLVLLSSLLFNMGDTDKAMTAATHALKVNEFEPITNFLMAELYMKKDNLLSAMYHLRKAFEQDSENIDVIQRLWHVVCQIKGNSRGLASANVKSTAMSPNMFVDQGKNHFAVEYKSLIASSSYGQSATSINSPKVVTLVEDDVLPEVLVKVKHEHRFPPMTLSECQMLSSPNMWHFTSTWLSVSAKGIDVTDHLGKWEQMTTMEPVQPFCDSKFPSSALTLDHLAGVRHRNRLTYPPETGLKEFFQTLGRSGKSAEAIESVATRLTLALQKNSTSWVLTTLAALHWRIMGNADQAISCLRVALHFAPRYARDIPLVSLANVLHRAGLFNGALVVANMALEISPDIVVIHFTMANIFADKGDLARAESYYKSTLALQPSFEPAKDRVRFIQCSTLQRESQQ